MGSYGVSAMHINQLSEDAKLKVQVPCMTKIKLSVLHTLQSYTRHVILKTILALASQFYTLDGVGSQCFHQFKITDRIRGYKGVKSA